MLEQDEFDRKSSASILNNWLTEICELLFPSSLQLINGFSLLCSKPLQLKMSHYCEEVFGDMLLNKNLETHPVSALRTFTVQLCVRATRESSS